MLSHTIPQPDDPKYNADFLEGWKAHSKDLHQKSRELFTHDIDGMNPDY